MASFITTRQSKYTSKILKLLPAGAWCDTTCIDLFAWVKLNLVCYSPFVQLCLACIRFGIQNFIGSCYWESAVCVHIVCENNFPKNRIHAEPIYRLRKQCSTTMGATLYLGRSYFTIAWGMHIARRVPLWLRVFAATR